MQRFTKTDRPLGGSKQQKCPASQLADLDNIWAPQLETFSLLTQIPSITSGRDTGEHCLEEIPTAINQTINFGSLIQRNFEYPSALCRRPLRFGQNNRGRQHRIRPTRRPEICIGLRGLRWPRKHPCWLAGRCLGNMLSKWHSARTVR